MHVSDGLRQIFHFSKCPERTEWLSLAKKKNVFPCFQSGLIFVLDRQRCRDESYRDVPSQIRASVCPTLSASVAVLLSFMTAEQYNASISLSTVTVCEKSFIKNYPGTQCSIRHRSWQNAQIRWALTLIDLFPLFIISKDTCTKHLGSSFSFSAGTDFTFTG